MDHKLMIELRDFLQEFIDRCGRYDPFVEASRLKGQLDNLITGECADVDAFRKGTEDRRF